MKTDKLEELKDKVLEWATNKGLLDNVSEDRILKQSNKVLEEIGETCRAYLKGDREELLDGIGDIAVTIIILNEMEGSYFLSFDLSDVPGNKNTLIDVTSYFVSGEYNNALGSLILFAVSQDTTLEHCLELAYNVIAKRTGKMVNNTFIKD